MTTFAGSACLEITPAKPCTLAGYEARSHASCGVHDPLSLRALFVEDAGGQKAVVISADILWYGPRIADAIRAKLSGELGILPSHVFLAATHTHSAPDALDFEANGDWLRALPGRALEAATLARTRKEPVRIRVHSGESHIGINRREWRDGRIELGHNPKGTVDRELRIVSLEGSSGRQVARLLSFGCHGVVMGEDNYIMSGDWPGTAVALLEEEWKCPVLFCNGGAGNINPRIGPQDSFEPVLALAKEFVADCNETLMKEGRDLRTRDVSLHGIEASVELPRKQDSENGRHMATVPLHGLRFGEVALIGYPGEMFCQTVMAVKAATPMLAVIVCSYVDAGTWGYVPVCKAYEEGGYEVSQSLFSEEAEVLLRNALIRLLEQL